MTDLDKKPLTLLQRLRVLFRGTIPPETPTPHQLPQLTVASAQADVLDNLHLLETRFKSAVEQLEEHLTPEPAGHTEALERLHTLETRLQDVIQQLETHLTTATPPPAVVPEPVPEPAPAPAPPDTLVETLATLTDQLGSLRQQMHQQHSQGSHLETLLSERLGGLEKQLGRVGREQFKVNSLAETQAEQFQQALEMLQASDARQTEEVEALHRQIREADIAGRQQVAKALLPTLDSLDEALRSGRMVLDRPVHVPPPPSLLERIRGKAIEKVDTIYALRDSLAGWLTGLTYVQQRLLDVLAEEGIQPIEAIGQPFDPHLHIVLDVVPARDDLPTGTVASEIRRGYRMGERVLRHAEVVVAKAAEPADAATSQNDQNDQAAA